MNFPNKKPIIAVTMGDVNGVGPEIAVKAALSPELAQICRPALIGSARAAKRAAELLGVSANIRVCHAPDDAPFRPDTINIIETGTYDEASLKPGQIQEISGRMSADFIRRSIELGMAGRVGAIATAPINKQAIKQAGVAEPGHTEIYETGTGSKQALTMFQCGQLRVFFLSRHVSLQRALALVTRENILNYLEKACAELLVLGIKNPRIAVAALNPHSGDNGLFGDEEQREIAPAVEGARARGINCVGPVPADSVFHLAKGGAFDAVLSLYHDQGHIACKTLDFERTVSLTLGLPFLRTSVDHGTAFDVAWKGTASAVSMIEAISVAAQYSK